MEQNFDFLDMPKVNSAINATLELFAQYDLNLLEVLHVTKTLYKCTEATLREKPMQ